VLTIFTDLYTRVTIVDVRTISIESVEEAVAPSHGR
jgi:hypothetical protein